MAASRWISFLLLALAVVAGAGYALQRQAAAGLRAEIALLRDEPRALARLRAENEKLQAAQIPAAELERLRADRLAVLRLRTEIDAMQARAAQRAP